MKNINSIILIVLCIFTLFSSFGGSVSAQPAIPSLSKPSSIILNSQPEIYIKNIVLDSKTYKAGDTVKGSFTLLNNKAQPVSDVYYKVTLAGDYQKNNLAKTFYDSVKNGPFSLAGRESKKIDFTYVLPKAVAGDNLGIQVSALLGSGMPLGWGDSMIEVEGEMSLLKVSKAVISIGDNKFDFQTGTAVSREDEAFLEVNLINPTKNSIGIIPKIKIYNNITPAISSELSLNTVTILANSSSVIKYELPKFENKVGVYVGNLSFSDANGNKRALDLQFNYRIPELNNSTNTDASQNGVSNGKVYTTMDYVFFVGLILLGLGLIGLIVFLVIKFKKKIVLFSFLTFLLFGGIFGFLYSTAAAIAVGTQCVDGTLYVNSTFRTAPTDEGVMNWYSATNACSAKGAGWRLLTKPEFLDVIDEGQQSIYYSYPNRAALRFGAYLYWTSTEYSGGENDWSEAWYHSFMTSIGNDTNHKRNHTNHVRCIKIVAAGSDCLGHVLNITKNGIGSGTVTSDVGGISCGANCSATYTSGTTVTLTATPSASSTFTGWSGACTGTGTCLVTMTSVKSLTANFTPTFSGGDGSIANPYRISACMELQAVNTALSSNFILINDIDCSDTVNWNGGAGFLPIGRYNSITPGPYTGNFNGAGFKIINLTINRPPTDSVGLFSHIYGGTIRNVGLVNANISGSGIVGALVAFANGAISNCSSSGSVTTTGWHVGGLVGGTGTGGIITNSYSSSSVSGGSYVGGLVGSGWVSISNSFSSGSVIGSNNVGGLIGATQSGSISNSYATGSVTGSTNVGGLVGAPSSTIFTSSYYDKLTSGQIDTGKGIPKMTSEMKTKNTFTNWDFTNIWGLTSGFNNGYPCLRWQSDCVSTPENVIISTPSCGGSTVQLSWPIVTGAAQYKVYKDNTFLATTTATSSDISNISTSTVLSVSAISATGVESATSTGVSVPAGIKPTNLLVSGVELVDGSGHSLVTTDMSPDQEFYLQGTATAENSLSQYLHMNYFSNVTSVPPWVLSGSTIFTTPISSSSSTAVRGGQFSIGPFTTPSTPDDYLISYYVSAYPSCVVDYNNASTTLIMDPAGFITYTIPPSASCGSADGGTSLSFPQGPAACSYGEATMTNNPSVLATGPWTWDCNDGDITDSCSATKTQLVLDSRFNCSLSTPATNQLNSTAILTASTTPACPSCTKKWTLIDINNPAPGNLIPVSDNTSYTLNNIFNTVGLKTITAQVFSADGLSYGNTCTTTTNVMQGEVISREI